MNQTFVAERVFTTMSHIHLCALCNKDGLHICFCAHLSTGSLRSFQNTVRTSTCTSAKLARAAAESHCVVQEAEVIALPRIIVKRWRDAGVDILVNNAGMGRNDASLFDGNTASWVEMVSTNTLGVCMCTREALQVCTPVNMQVALALCLSVLQS